MQAVAKDFGIKEALEQLGVKDINEGTSTGSNHFSNGELIESFSPVDGQLIAKYYLDDNRTPVGYDELPKHLVDALIAT